MISLSSVGKREKNKLSTGSAFVILLDIVVPDDVIRICYNTEDIVWNGNLYQAFPFTLGEVRDDSAGSEPSVELKVDNTSQALQGYIEQAGGGANLQVILRVVNTEDLRSSEPELEESYIVESTKVDQQYIAFTLGSEYSSKTRRPLDRYMKNNCRFKYKGLRCGCKSTLPTCNHTLKDCRERGNSQRFGGFPGIDQKGVYSK